jgi:hypothetical protein
MFLGLKMVIAKPQWSSVRSSSFTDLVLAFRHVSSSSLSSQVSVFPARSGVVPPSLSCVSCPLARFLNPLLFLFAGAGSHGHAFEFASSFSYLGTPSLALLLASTPSLHVSCSNWVRCGAPEVFSAFAISDGPSSGAISERRMKKKVAMWLGYVGTRYKGTCHAKAFLFAKTVDAVDVLMRFSFWMKAGLQIQRGPGSAQSKWVCSRPC